MSKVNDETPERGAEVQEWIDANLSEQEVRHKKIQQNMDHLIPQRNGWIANFFERLQTRGFNFNGDLRRKIAKEDLPEKPNRPHKVTY
jgi:hypothetical protein